MGLFRFGKQLGAEKTGYVRVRAAAGRADLPVPLRVPGGGVADRPPGRRCRASTRAPVAERRRSSRGTSSSASARAADGAHSVRRRPDETVRAHVLRRSATRAAGRRDLDGPHDEPSASGPASRTTDVPVRRSSDGRLLRRPRSWRFFSRATAARAPAPRGIFGKFGGYGASPSPAASSRSTHSSSTRRSHTASSIPAWTSPRSREPLAHRRDREVLGLDVRQLVPGDRRRHRRVRPRAHRVGRGDRPVAGVLVVVDEDLLAALLLPPRGRDDVGQPPLDLARERERAAPHHAEPPVRLDAAEDVDAAVPGRLRPAGVPDLVEHLADARGHALARPRTSCRAADRRRCAARRGARCPAAATATGGSRSCRGSPPTRPARPP